MDSVYADQADADAPQRPHGGLEALVVEANHAGFLGMLKAEDEHVVIGGLYRVRLATL